LPTVSVEVLADAWSELGLPRGTFEANGVPPSLNVTAPQVTGLELASTTVAVKVTD
jgi:hypothetical protein